MKKFGRSQTGSMYSTLFLIAMVGTLVLVGFRVFPIYMNEMKIQSAISAIAKSPEASESNMTVQSLRKLLRARWDIDDIEHLKVGDIKFLKTKQGKVMRYDYEVRTELFANWSLVLQFDDELSLGGGS